MRLPSQNMLCRILSYVQILWGALHSLLQMGLFTVQYLLSPFFQSIHSEVCTGRWCVTRQHASPRVCIYVGAPFTFVFIYLYMCVYIYVYVVCLGKRHKTNWGLLIIYLDMVVLLICKMHTHTHSWCEKRETGQSGAKYTCIYHAWFGSNLHKMNCANV